jgi:hypothetical protein
MLSIQMAALALVAIALAASGCGKSSTTESTVGAAAATSTQATTASSTTNASTSTQSSKPLTRTEFIAAGETICAHLNTQLTASPSNLSAIGRVLPQAAAYERTEYDELSKLVPPASMTSNWKKFLDGTRQWSEDSAKLGEFARAHKLTAAGPLAVATKNAHEQLAHLAKQAGFKECAAL